MLREDFINRITMAKLKKLKPSTKETVRRLTDETRREVNRNKIMLQEVVLDEANRKDGEADYSKVKFQRLFLGYDFLENQIFVRHYLTKKYKLKRTIYLDVLLFLFAKNIFTINDFVKIRPFRFTLVNVKKLIEWGFVEQITYKKNPYERLYRSTLLTKEIVESYYKMCAGEIPIPEDDPCLTDSEYRGDQIKNELIKEINKSSISESKKSFWALYKK